MPATPGRLALLVIVQRPAGGQGAAAGLKPTKTTTASVPGAKINFGVPNTCVKAGSTFKVTLTWKKQRRKGNKFVKVRRADFYIGSKRVKIDKKAPFTQTLKVKAGTKPGSTITVKARAFVKVTKRQVADEVDQLEDQGLLLADPPAAPSQGSSP